MIDHAAHLKAAGAEVSIDSVAGKDLWRATVSGGPYQLGDDTAPTIPQALAGAASRARVRLLSDESMRPAGWAAIVAACEEVTR